MSADNGYLVQELKDKPGKFGVFYYIASVDYPEAIWDNAVVRNRDKWPYAARHVYGKASEAIFAAHRLESNDPTEYGVTVAQSVLDYI